jgi:hypothetical protein
MDERFMTSSYFFRERRKPAIQLFNRFGNLGWRSLEAQVGHCFGDCQFVIVFRVVFFLEGS